MVHSCITEVARHIPPAAMEGIFSDEIMKGFTVITEKMAVVITSHSNTMEDNKKVKGFSALGDIEGCMLLWESSWYTANEIDEEGNYHTGLVRDKPVDSCTNILESTTPANSHTILWQRMAKSYGCKYYSNRDAVTNLFFVIFAI